MVLLLVSVQYLGACEPTARLTITSNFPLGGIVIASFLFFVKLPVDSLCNEKLTFAQKVWRIDLVGFFIFCVAVTLFLLGLQWGGTEYPWNDGRVIAPMVLGLVGFVGLGLWFWWKGEEALIPPRLLNNRINAMITVTSFVQSGATVTSLYWLPIWFQSIKRASPFESGVLILPMIISQLVFSIICGVLVQKTGYYLPEVIGGNVLVAIGAGLTSTFTRLTPLGEELGFQVLLGAGRGLVLQLLVTAMQANVPRSDASIASAYCMFSQFLGSAFFSSLAKTIFTSSMATAVAEYAPFLKDPSYLINMGATELPEHFRGAQLNGVTDAYNAAIVNVFVSFFLSASHRHFYSNSWLVSSTRRRPGCVLHRLGYGVEELEACEARTVDRRLRKQRQHRKQRSHRGKRCYCR